MAWTSQRLFGRSALKMEASSLGLAPFQARKVVFWPKSVVSRQNASVSHREPTLSGHDTTVSGHDTTFSGRDTTFSGHETTVSSHDTTRSGRDATLSGGDTTFSSTEPTLSNLDTTAPRHDRTLSMRRSHPVASPINPSFIVRRRSPVAHRLSPFAPHRPLIHSPHAENPPHLERQGCPGPAAALGHSWAYLGWLFT